MDCIDIGIIGVVVVGVTYLVLESRYSRNKRKTLDEKYNVNKFPVTSIMGNQYYAEIIYNHREYCNKRFSCKIYKRLLKKNGKFKDELLLNRDVGFESFDYDYVEVVKITIGEYEAEHKAEILKKKHKDESITMNKKLFNEWDGVIREES
ncbi:hypothetical protein G9F71_008585 [Clostridium sp. FP2]|uniref:hypothetical protein n=1 Tax=Clostridium sp. FP2 TaxID=2724481 RepID=UPI0013E963A8|nr:hypothetical protein [Clostridium sp. FP2]MBZ9622909.1 hypothetical protein [Clostridium sp. FP2]